MKKCVNVIPAVILAAAGMMCFTACGSSTTNADNTAQKQQGVKGMNEALVIIDIQNNYFEEDGYLLHEPEKAAAKAAQILEKFRSQGKPVIHVRHLFNVTGKKNAEYLLAFNKAVAPIPGEVIVSKSYPSSFLQTDLQQQLKERSITSLVIVGMMSHMCIDTTVRAAQDYTYKVTVIHDACTTRDLEWNGITVPAETAHNTIMASLNGAFATVISCEEFLSR